MEKFSDPCCSGETNIKADNDESCDDGISPYSEAEARLLAIKLANKESFSEAKHVLIKWLERGECNEGNSTMFFSLIELCFDHLQRLKMEEKNCLLNFEKSVLNLEVKDCLIRRDMKSIENAFKVIEQENILENFSEIERENIQVIKNDILAFKQEILMNSGSNVAEEKLNETNKMSAIILKRMIKNLTSKTAAANADLKIWHKRLEELKREKLYYKLEVAKVRLQKNSGQSAFECAPDNVQREHHIAGFISIVLCEYESGLDLEAIHSYLNMGTQTATASEIEIILMKFPECFKGIGLGQEKKWFHVGFNA